MTVENRAGMIDVPAYADPRESMRRLPALLQRPLTFLTGKAYAGQPATRLTPTWHVLAGFTAMVAGVGVSAASVVAAGWWLMLLPLGWAMTLHGMRNLRMLIYHQCAHRNMWGSRPADRAVGSLIAGLLVVQNLDRYAEEHVREHHAVRHMTVHDPTVQAFLVGLRLRPGMTRRQMWRRLVLTLLSPLFHVRFLIARGHSCLHRADRTFAVATVAGYASAAVVVTLWSAWPVALLAWVVPLTVPYQISNTLRLCVKHTFPPRHATRRTGREYFAGLTAAVFLGEPAPRTDAVRPWLRWAARMVLVHLPARYLVVTGDTCVHDYHHRFPMSRSWPNYLFARAADDADGHPGWPPYEEVWGLAPAISRVFDSLSAADPVEYDVAQLAGVGRRSTFAAFDD